MFPVAQEKGKTLEANNNKYFNNAIQFSGKKLAESFLLANDLMERLLVPGFSSKRSLQGPLTMMVKASNEKSGMKF